MEIYMLDLKECVCKYTVVAKSDFNALSDQIVRFMKLLFDYLA